jgi:hypothetical protein
MSDAGAKNMRRIERGSHWAIGRYVIAETRTVEGGDGRYKETWTRSLFPKNQVRHTWHPRHPTGYGVETGKVNACVSPSCSFYSALCKYGEFTWGSSE